MRARMNLAVLRLAAVLVCVGPFVSFPPSLGAQGGSVTAIPAARQKPRVTVPNVIGLTLDQARNDLIHARLAVGKITESLHPGASGTVFDQSPPGNTLAAAGSAVDLHVVQRPFVSVVPLVPQPAGRVSVPNLLGQTREQAAATLEGVRLHLGNVGTGSGNGPPGTVFVQDPPADKIVRVGTAINITLVAAGNSSPIAVPKSTRVPPLIRLDLESARTRLGAVRLQLGNVEERVSDQVEPGKIFDQSPGAGTVVRLGTRVNVAVARAPLRVPSLQGDTVSQAEAALRRSNLRLGSVREGFPEAPQAAGTIFSQTPVASTVVEPGQVVDVWIVRQLVSVPDVVGLGLAEARVLLRQGQLQVGTVTEAESLASAGRVVSQGVPPESMVEPGTQVDLVVGHAPAYTASVHASSTNPTVGEPVTFSASVSPKIAAPEFQFDFGDGQKTGWAAASQAFHTYRKAGNFQLVAAVRAPKGTVPPATLAVQVRSPEIAILLSADRNRAYRNGVVRLTAMLRPANQGAEYQFDFGDRTLSAWQSSPIAMHRYATAGTFQAHVFVRVPGAEPVHSAAVLLEIVAFPWTPIVVALLLVFVIGGWWIYRRVANPPGLPASLSVVQSWDPGRQEVAATGRLLDGPSLVIRAAPSRGEQGIEPGRPANARGDSRHD